MNIDTFLDLVGPMPNKTDLNTEVLESVDCGSYTREKVEYSVELNDRVRAYVCIPKNIDEGVPAIFCHHQHNGEFDWGKSEVVGLVGDPEQAYAVELAERGYITLAPDAIAFEERNWSPGSGRAEIFELTSRLIKGKTLLAKVLHDMSVGLDYLETRKEVDNNRIGFIGHSYGGRMAIWSPAFDKRIKVSVSNCGCVNYKDSLTHDAGIQAEFCVPNFINHGDIEDIVRLIEPAAIYISATDDDKWSRGAQGIFDYAQSAFKQGKINLKIWPGKHMFTKEMRASAYDFLEEHLSNNLV
ncbi:MAG TPA: dienelactone hydrolase family protein [Acidimicrobiia bacterium]|nr:dienelactone hydrolase family protein [Acidimicrobiia bacterium]